MGVRVPPGEGNFIFELELHRRTFGRGCQDISCIRMEHLGYSHFIVIAAHFLDSGGCGRDVQQLWSLHFGLHQQNLAEPRVYRAHYISVIQYLPMSLWQDFLALTVLGPMPPYKIFRSIMMSVLGLKRTLIPEFTTDKAFFRRSACRNADTKSSWSKESKEEFHHWQKLTLFWVLINHKWPKERKRTFFLKLYSDVVNFLYFFQVLTSDGLTCPGGYACDMPTDRLIWQTKDFHNGSMCCQKHLL